MRSSNLFFGLFLLCASGFVSALAGCGAKSSNARGATDFSILPIEVVSSESQRPGSAVDSTQTKVYHLKACVIDIGSVKPIVSQAFTLGSETSQNHLVTDSQGCLFWEESIQFRYLSSEAYQTLTRTLFGESPYRGQQELRLAFDPWKDGSSSFVDLQKYPLNSVSSSSLVKSKDTASPLSLTDISYTYEGRDGLELNRYLSLSVHRTYSLRFKPVLVRSSRGDKGSSIESIPAGRFKLRAALYSRGGILIAQTQTVVESMAGQVIAHVVFPVDFPQFPLLALRNSLLIELSSDESSDESNPGFGPAVVSVDFLPVADSSVTGITPEPAGFDAKIALLAKPETYDTAQSPSDLFMAHYHLRPLSENVLRRQHLSEPQVGALVGGKALPSAELSTLCSLFYPEVSNAGPLERLFTQETDGDKCHKNPAQYLDQTDVLLVDEVGGVPQILANESSEIRVEASINRDLVNASTQSSGNRKSWQTYKTVRTGIETYVDTSAGVEGGISFLGNGVKVAVKGGARVSAEAEVGGTVESERFVATQISQSESLGTHVGVAEARSFSVERLELSFEARTRKCVILRPALKDGVFPGYLLCGREKSPFEAHHDAWYYVSEKFANFPMILRDTTTESGRLLTKIIRGDRNFEMFKTALEDHSKTFVLRRELHVENINELSRQGTPREIPNSVLFSSGAFAGLLENK